jgi:hypothetical protein
MRKHFCRHLHSCLISMTHTHTRVRTHIHPVLCRQDVVSVEKMSVDEMSVDKMSVDEMSQYQKMNDHELEFHFEKKLFNS